VYCTRSLVPIDRLGGEGARAQVAREPGQLAVGGGEARLEEHRLEVRQAGEVVPDPPGGAGVGREGDGAAAVVDHQAERADGVRHRDGRHHQPRPLHRHHGLEGGGAQEGPVGARQPEEIGPHAAVEDVAVEELEDVRRGEQLHAVGPGGIDVVEEQRQRRDVVEVLVGEEHVADRLLPPDVGQQAQRAGVDRHRAVDDERHEILDLRLGKTRRQQFDPHGR